MDPIKTLIQQLMDAANSGEDKRVLLALVEDLRNAINDGGVINTVPESVSVVMPNGFQSPVPSVATPKPTIKPALSVPRPPSVVVLEEAPVPEAAQIEVSAPQPISSLVKEDMLEPLNADLPTIELIEEELETTELPESEPVMTVAPINEPVNPAPVPEVTALVMNMELMLTPEMIAEAVALEMQALNPVEEPEWSQPHVFSKQDEGPKELNEKMAQRSKMLNEVFVQKEPELVEVLAKPRIADLRKSISINEKYQFIGSLFRGDEDMFERSVKTLNNFTVMQEAQYWMQRELLIKLGWNEEDELVQRFFELVSRRFN